ALFHTSSDDFPLCPFTVVVFPSDLKSVGDVRQLQGRMVEIHGQLKEYDGRAEIVLEEYRQLGGAGTRIPPLPKTTTSKRRAAIAREPSATPRRNGRLPGSRPLT